MATDSSLETAQFADQRRGLFAWSLLCGVLLCGAIGGPYYLGRIYTADDLWAYHLPVRQFYAECLAKGHPFDWMPSLYSGFYLTGEGQAGTYHPLHWLLYRLLPLRAAFDLELLLNYPFLLAGTYFFLRRHVRREGAMFGALVFAFSGFNTLHFVHPNAVAVVAHIPWLLLAIHVALRGHAPTSSRDAKVKQPSKRSIILAEASIPLLTASQLLLGYPQYVWFSVLAETVYAVLIWFSLRHRQRSAGPLECTNHGLPARSSQLAACFRLAGLKVLGMLIGAVQLLPTLDALRESERQSVGGDFAHQGSLHVLNVLQFIAPYLFRDRVVGGNTHEFGLYIGAVPIALIVWMLVGRRGTSRRHWFALTAAGCAALALWLAIGQAGGLYSLQTHLPIIGKFRFPARYVVLVHLALATAAAVAMIELARITQARHGDVRASSTSEARHRTLSLGPLWRLTTVSFAVCVAAPWLWGNEHIEPLPLRLVGPALLVGATTLLVFARRGAQWALPALIVLTATDLGIYGGSYAIWRGTYSPETAFATIPDADGSKIATEPRGQEHSLRVGNQMVLKGWHQVDGYAGLEPARQLDYRNVTALRVAGVERVLRSPATESIPGLVPLDNRWLKVPKPLSRARIVEDYLETDTPRQAIQHIDVDRTALVDRVPESPLVSVLSGDFTPSILSIAEGPGHILLVGKCCCPQLLVLSERFHSGWKATMNGTPVEVVRANGDFLGCMTDPVYFVAEFEFRPASLVYGKWISGLGLVLLALYSAARCCRL